MQTRGLKQGRRSREPRKLGRETKFSACDQSQVDDESLFDNGWMNVVRVGKANGSRTLSNERGMILSEVGRQRRLGLKFKMVSILELGVSPETEDHSFRRNNRSKLMIKCVFLSSV